ncbi:PREDICTED: uncharacterized protein LOC104766628 isoform X2 [Camelina sativa]|uniref:Uncharacterized protein LOC104766628 isoform X2 n=1 Tax=Camelina sativa TaxID=90675 RepID=A0ABM0XP95_CAMSA|nr:PREDICTED: uncharacterized protein LOC104766628 isoform X2 [Camelina sativa]
MGRTLFFRLHVGGYWAADGSYNGGETRCLSLDFEYPSLAMLTDMVSSTGYAENMNDPYLDDVLVGEGEEEEEERSDGEQTDFYRDDYVESDDSDDDGEQPDFYVDQEFVSKEKCKEAIEKYAVKAKVNIHFKRSERKKIEGVCVQAGCNWRIYASITSRSNKMVVKSYKGTHSCYPSGIVDLYIMTSTCHMKSLFFWIFFVASCLLLMFHSIL